MEATWGYKTKGNTQVKIYRTMKNQILKSLYTEKDGAGNTIHKNLNQFQYSQHYNRNPQKKSTRILSRKHPSKESSEKEKL